MGAVVSCIEGICQAIGSVLMGIANAIGAIIMFIVDGVIAIFDIVSCREPTHENTNTQSEHLLTHSSLDYRLLDMPGLPRSRHAQTRTSWT